MNIDIDSNFNYESNFGVFSACDVEYPKIGFDDNLPTAIFHQNQFYNESCWNIAL